MTGYAAARTPTEEKLPFRVVDNSPRMLSQDEIILLLNGLIEQINGSIAKNGVPFILLTLIGVGVLLLLVTYLPWLIGILLVILIAWWLLRNG